MALTIKSSALTGRIVPFFISSCSDRSSRLIANRKLGNKVLRQISFPHSLVRISLYINKGSSGLVILFNRIVSKRKCIRNHWKQQTDEIKKSAFCSYEMFFSRKANLFFLPIPFGVISMNRYYYLVGAYAPLDLMVTSACLVR